ncbi:MAG: ankyrin repeat domain-containing protein [Spirochaetota bacterium]
MKIKSLYSYLIVLLIFLTFISCSSLHKAAKDGNLIMADDLIKKGDNVNSVDQNGWTPLLWASYYNHSRVMELLLDNGADANFKIKDLSSGQPGGGVQSGGKIGYTALHIAAFYNYSEIVKILLNHKADINITENTNKTPLILAAYYGHLDIAKLLFEKGADPNMVDNSGNTALVYARKYGFAEIWELLSGKKIGK